MTRRRPLFAVLLLVGACAALAALISGRDGPLAAAEPAAPPTARVLPGLKADGFIQLPNGWRLKPAGRQVEVGDFPVNLAVHPSGQYLAVLHAGLREHGVSVVELNRARPPKIVSRVNVDQAFYGLCFSPDGRTLFASGGEYEVVHAWDFRRGLLSNVQALRIAPVSETFVPSGLAVSPDGRDLFVCGVKADAVVRLPLDNPDNLVRIELSQRGNAPPATVAGAVPSPPDGRKENDPTGAKGPDGKPLTGNPYACLVDPNGKRLFVSLWSKSAVAVIDLATNAVAAVWATKPHPTEMALSPDGKSLFVACADSPQVVVLDTATGKPRQTVGCALYPNAPAGNTPASLALSPDGEMLFVANADANNLAVFNSKDAARALPLGYVPTGWYPTAVRYNPVDRTVYVTNGKGATSRANRHGPDPVHRAAADLGEYIAQLMRGTLSAIDLPTPADMPRLSTQAFACSPLKSDLSPVGEAVPAGHPIPRKAGDASPIKHVV
jgi:DNA-binding beta-propeller fold protein YncE